MVRGAMAVMLLSAPITDADLQRWLDRLASRYGPAAARAAHGQQTRQWIRRNTMLRVTSRREAGRMVASVSLVDGALLDGLNTP
jgi:hypothetical protein